MNPWPFVIAAYSITLVGTMMLVVWAWTTMKRAEARAEELKRER